MNLIYIGERFHLETRGEMSSLYNEIGVKKYWYQVHNALDKGIKVNIRPATESELEFYERELNKWKKSWNMLDLGV